jgi:hypothetical protein
MPPASLRLVFQCALLTLSLSCVRSFQALLRIERPKTESFSLRTHLASVPQPSQPLPGVHAGGFCCLTLADATRTVHRINPSGQNPALAGASSGQRVSRYIRCAFLHSSAQCQSVDHHGTHEYDLCVRRGVRQQRRKRHTCWPPNEGMGNVHLPSASWHVVCSYYGQSLTDEFTTMNPCTGDLSHGGIS